MGIQQGVASLARIVGPFWAEVAYGALGAEWPFWTGSLTMLAAAAVGLGALLALRRPLGARS
jgi:hypothetical protein